MIYVTGDTHGYIEYFTPCSEIYRSEEKNLKAGDTLLVCGDFGFVFWNKPDEARLDALYNEDKCSEIYNEILKNKYCYISEADNLKNLSEKPYTIAFVLGNHENYDRLFSEFPIVNYCSGRAIKIKENIFGLITNEVYTIENKNFYVFGGALSPDKASRKAYESKYAYKIHWEQELPTDSDYKKASEVLKKYNNSFDYILTHHAPLNMVYRLNCTPGDDIELSNFLQWIFETLSFRHWYFGHFHQDIQLDNNITCCYEKITKIGE